MIKKIIQVANKLSKGKLKLEETEGVIAVYFHTDVSQVAFLLGLGKVGVNCKISRPQQVVRLGRDTVIAAQLIDGTKIYLQIDARGFLDVLTLEGANASLQASKIDSVDEYLMDLDCEFFHNDGAIIVTLDSDAQAGEIVRELAKPFKLRIDSPSVLRQKSFAVVGDITVQKVGKALRIFKE